MSDESGPGREGKARCRHVLEGDDAAGERVGREEGAAIVTELGIARPPYEESLAALVRGAVPVHT